METKYPDIAALDSAVGMTADREARSLQWFAARTQMNCERKAEKEFLALGVETYLPIQEELHQWSDRKKKVKRIVIPMILFVKMNSEDVKNTFHSRYCYGFLGNDRRNTMPQPIPEREIEVLRFMLGQSVSSVFIEQVPLNLGDKVKVVRGDLKGLHGNVISNVHGDTYLYVKLDILGCAKVRINLSDLEKII